MKKMKMAVVIISAILICIGVNFYKSRNQVSEPGNILEACREVSNHYVKKQAHYASIHDELVWNNIKEFYDRDAICDPTYVALVLYKSKLLKEEYINSYNYNWSGEGGIPRMLMDAGWKKVAPEEINPGDIVVNYGIYCCIYAGNKSYWDYTSCIFGDKNAGKPHPNYVDVEQCLIFRAPNP